MRTAGWLMGLMVGLAPAAWACGYGPEETLEHLLAEHARREAAGEGPEALAELEARIDEVAGARDAAFSGLFWHRDLAQARQVAAAEGKPVLSLRLLGELTSERSCANSRFFRVALYADVELARWLRDDVVLHWESVRPAPRITIDMGDGRKLERTIAGNSIHYLLLPDGTVVDALPGLYGPGAFADALRPAVQAARVALTLPEQRRAAVIASYQRAAHLRLSQAAAQVGAAQDGAQVGARPGARPGMRDGGRMGAGDDARNDTWAGGGRRGGLPTAADAAPLAMGKAMVERPMLTALGQTPPPDDPAWTVAGAAYLERCRLDARSRRLLGRKLPADRRDGLVAVTRRFEEVMARDTAQNELRHRPTLLAWLLAGAGADLAALNRRVYAELFRTPDDDPWLGLAPADELAAIDGGGLTGP
ncbi:MAG: hypothetical protein KF878_14615 [Planctomycetes bacterium]|nr:hypothetical protein [Planctomycetota bacterium]